MLIRSLGDFMPQYANYKNSLFFKSLHEDEEKVINDLGGKCS